MQEVNEITEYPVEADEKINIKHTEHIPFGLEIVEQQLVNIVQELQEKIQSEHRQNQFVENEETLTKNEPEQEINKSKSLDTQKQLPKIQKPSLLSEKSNGNRQDHQVQKSFATNPKAVNDKQKLYSKSNQKKLQGLQKITILRASNVNPKNHIPLRKPEQTHRPNNHVVSVTNDTLKLLKERVDQAIRDRKTFTVCGNCYPIRRALETRGWIEKLRITYGTYDRDTLRRLNSLSIQDLLKGINDPRTGYLHRRVIMSKLLNAHQVDFYWDSHFDAYRVNKDGIKLTLINRFRNDLFRRTSKQSLCEMIKISYWYYIPGCVNIKHPRSYDLSSSDDPIDFIGDFKLTAAMSLLKWIAKTSEVNLNKIMSNTGRVPLRVYHFAKTELTKTLQKCRHEDIDHEIEDALDFQWNEFLQYYYKIVHNGYNFKCDGRESCSTIVSTSKNLLSKLEEFCPHLRMDGIMNIWILKPIVGSRGEGIYLCRSLQYILKVIRSNTSTKYIVQKYIERPLLIYNTKFDIRQWFLISNASPLTIWMYRECYIRFSSQLYNLRNLHESVHLTNNSVQKRYKNCSRNSALPSHNMWDSSEFKRYLESKGHGNVFKDIIYPGMKESIRGAVLMNDDRLATRKNTFELYGSDFMLTEDFQPWLIEINTCPAIHSSTPITARMCPQMLDDIIKVMVDYAKNPKASTGRFELLYKKKPSMLPQVQPDELKLGGTKLTAKYFYTPKSPTIKNLHGTDSDKEIMQPERSIVMNDEMKNALQNLLNLIQNELERRKKLKERFKTVDRKSETTNVTRSTNSNEPNWKNYNLDNIRIVKSEDNLKIIESQHIKLEIIKTKSNKSEYLEQNRDETSPQLQLKSAVKNIIKDIIESVWNFTFKRKPTDNERQLCLNDKL